MLRHTAAALGAVLSLTAAAAIGVVVTAGPAAAATGGPKVPVQGCCERTRLVPGQQLVAGTSSETSRLSATGLPPVEPAGSVYGQTETGFNLTLQSDGNLVEYRTGPGATSTAVWSTRTTSGKRLVFQSDRNVVLYDATGRALWSTGTAGSAAAYFSPYGNGQVVTQDAAGRFLTTVGTPVTPAPGVDVQGAASPGRTFVLNVQTDGNLVEYDVTDHDHIRAVWSTHTAGVGAVRLAAQSDGNLVLYQLSTGRAVWNSHTAGAGSGYYQLDVQDDANVVLYRTDGTHRQQAVWASHTRV